MQYPLVLKALIIAQVCSKKWCVCLQVLTILYSSCFTRVWGDIVKGDPESQSDTSEKHCHALWLKHAIQFRSSFHYSRWLLKWLLFFQLNHFSFDIKYLISTRWLANPNWGCSHFPQIPWSSYDYLIRHQSEDSHAHHILTKVPPIMLTIESRKVFWACSPISFKHMSFGMRSWSHT